MPRSTRLVVLAAGLVLAACGGGGSSADDARQVEEAVRRSLAAENAADVSAFLALWTDDGLRSYDAGTRDELEAGERTLGAEQAEVRRFVETLVEGNRAVTTLDARVEIGLYRMRYDLVNDGGRWLLDGFRFLGPTPPAPATTIVDVKAVEYGYDVDRAALSSGDFALRFTVAGQEEHEISILSLPAEIGKAEAVLALTEGRGTVPEGYAMVGHLAFGGPGEAGTYTLAETLAPGRYAFVCFLPVGGVDELGFAKVAGAEPHVARGMLLDFTVA